MIPDRIFPGQAPHGVVCVAYDLDDNEVTRSVVTRMDQVQWSAEDAGGEVAHRGGGSMAAFDGDTGERMFKGSKVEVIDGIRQPTTHHINDLQELERIVRHDGPWPWMMMGIFPAEGTEQPKAWWNWFCYTAGLSPEMELWAPCCSIEGRAAGNDLIGMVLNHIASGVVLGMVQPGDTVIVPLGVADDEDAGDVNSIWWIGDLVHGTQRHMVNMSAAQFVLPVQWSSPLGWEEP